MGGYPFPPSDVEALFSAAASTTARPWPARPSRQCACASRMPRRQTAGSTLKYFGCPVAFGADGNELQFPAALLAAACAGRRSQPWASPGGVHGPTWWRSCRPEIRSSRRRAGRLLDDLKSGGAQPGFGGAGAAHERAYLAAAPPGRWHELPGATRRLARAARARVCRPIRATASRPSRNALPFATRARSSARSSGGPEYPGAVPSHSYLRAPVRPPPPTSGMRAATSFAVGQCRILRVDHCETLLKPALPNAGRRYPAHDGSYHSATRWAMP